MVKAAWTNSISRGFGKFASCAFPSFMQIVINKIYVKAMGVDLINFHSASHYPTLNALFTRELMYQRDMPKDPSVIVSPADSLVSELGDLEESSALQIKDFDYCVKELLTDQIDEENLQRVSNGKFINFYLSPRDYHRYHAPMDMKVKKVIHVPGLLYPVNFTYLRKVESLFVKNERVIVECVDNSGKLFYMVLVGALNVGEMTLAFEPSIETNKDASQLNVFEYSDVLLKKGDELGMFKMGSTVVMIFEKEFVSLSSSVGKKVRFGEEVATKVH
ncbi:MAG: phosphatidylserine decarboxylase [Epsilonproteobacteria bacterium]|nr:phosphatidylserine decarboxylase [Campylobacterota bacterium]